MEIAWVTQGIITDFKHFCPCNTKYLSDSMSLDSVVWKRLPFLQMSDFSFISWRLSVHFFPVEWGIGRCGIFVTCWDCLCRWQAEPFISRNHRCDALLLMHVMLHVWQQVWWSTKALGILRNWATGSGVLKWAVGKLAVPLWCTLISVISLTGSWSRRGKISRKGIRKQAENVISNGRTG